MNGALMLPYYMNADRNRSVLICIMPSYTGLEICLHFLIQKARTMCPGFLRVVELPGLNPGPSNNIPDRLQA